MTRSGHSSSYFFCPHCGESVPANARVCRACGASEDCGWNDEPTFNEDDDDFDYDEYIAREFPDHSNSSVSSQKYWVALVVLAIITSIILGVLPF